MILAPAWYYLEFSFTKQKDALRLPNFWGGFFFYYSVIHAQPRQLRRVIVIVLGSFSFFLPVGTVALFIHFTRVPFALLASSPSLGTCAIEIRFDVV